MSLLRRSISSWYGLAKNGLLICFQFTIAMYLKNNRYTKKKQNNPTDKFAKQVQFSSIFNEFHFIQ